MHEQEKRLYRSTRDRMILGVCGGLAEYFNMNAFGMRFLVVVLTFLTGFWPGLIGYIVLGVILKPGPDRPFESSAEQEFWTVYQDSSTLALSKLERQFDELDKRLQRLESVVTSPRFDLDEQYRNL